MTDQLAAALGDAGLKVVGRASVLAVEAKHLSDQDAGRALGASMILHGRVGRAANRLRVWTQLVNAADGAAITTKAYDTTMTDVFGVQDELARTIAAALRPRVAAWPGVPHAHSARGTRGCSGVRVLSKGQLLLGSGPSRHRRRIVPPSDRARSEVRAGDGGALDRLLDARAGGHRQQRHIGRARA